MAVELGEALLLWNKSVTELGTEFKLPDISSPWLTKEFPISLHPTDNFEPEQGSRLPPTELFNLGPTVEIMEREASIPVPDISHLEQRLQNLTEQQGDYGVDFSEEGFGEHEISE